MGSWTKGRLVLVGDAAHPMLPRTVEPAESHYRRTLTNKIDQGQGGAQAIEDAAALHTVFSGLAGHPTAQDIQDRLKLFEAVRLKRASRIQIFSNAGQDEADKVEQRAKPYMGQGQHVPKTPAEYVQHNFGYDALVAAQAEVDRWTAVAA